MSEKRCFVQELVSSGKSPLRPLTTAIPPPLKLSMGQRFRASILFRPVWIRLIPSREHIPKDVPSCPILFSLWHLQNEFFPSVPSSRKPVKLCPISFHDPHPVSYICRPLTITPDPATCSTADCLRCSVTVWATSGLYAAAGRARHQVIDIPLRHELSSWTPLGHDHTTWSHGSSTAMKVTCHSEPSKRELGEPLLTRWKVTDWREALREALVCICPCKEAGLAIRGVVFQEKLWAHVLYIHAVFNVTQHGHNFLALCFAFAKASQNCVTHTARLDRENKSAWNCIWGEIKPQRATKTAGELLQLKGQFLVGKYRASKKKKLKKWEESFEQCCDHDRARITSTTDLMNYWMKWDLENNIISWIIWRLVISNLRWMQ